MCRAPRGREIATTSTMRVGSARTIFSLHPFPNLAFVAFANSAYAKHARASITYICI